MKKLLILCAGLILLGCTADERSTVIADYIQTQGNVKTDMSFSLVEIVDLGDVYGRDSLAIVKPLFAKAKQERLHAENDNLNGSIGLCVTFTEMINHLKANKKFYGTTYKERLAGEEARLAGYQEELKSLMDLVNKIKNDSIPWLKDSEKQLVGYRYEQMKKYEAKKDVILAHKAKATFLIKNTLLNNAEQEVTKTFAFSPNNKRVLGVIEHE